MDSDSFYLNVDFISTNGVILSPEQKTALQTSLTITKSNYKFHRLYFWGKIFGVKDDYFIAEGVSKNEFGVDKKILYSKDCVVWGLLPPATEESIAKARLIHSRFTGDPSNEFEYVETKKVDSGEEETAEEEETITIKEEDRLAAVIHEINHDVRIVPRGAYVALPTGEVHPNRSFEGLSVAEAAKLGSYMHFREAEKLNEKTLLERADLDQALDYMDTVDADVPRGSWSMQFERGSALMILRSLLWPGYIFYHVPGTRQFGSAYYGLGVKNIDLPFML